MRCPTLCDRRTNNPSLRMAAAGMKTEPGPTLVRWQVFGLAFATSALLYLHRYSFGYIKPALQEAWGLDKTELGRLDSAFSVCYSVLQFPFAILADRFGIRLVLTLLMLVWMAGLGMTASAASFRMMSAAQATLGVGQSAVYACLSRISWSWFPPRCERRCRAPLGFWPGGWGFGRAGSFSVHFSSAIANWTGVPRCGFSSLSASCKWRCLQPYFETLRAGTSGSTSPNCG